MKLGEIRSQMVAFRLSVDEEARALKDSYLALDRLHQLYRRFDVNEREMAEQVLTEWALSMDENVRFDALALIDDFKIASAVPALQTLLAHLASATSPGAPYEIKKVARIIAGMQPMVKA